MNNKLIIAFIVIILLGGGAYYVVSGSNQNALTSKTLLPTNSGQKQILETDPGTGAGEVASEKYVPYTPEAFAHAAGRRRVLFFHATWCPTCKVANEEFSANFDQIPDDVVVFKTDYDTERELKQKYDVTYQHTLVQVDGQGNEVTQWNGGGIDLLLASIQ